MSATYGFDFADREVSLSVTSPGGTEPVVSTATYLPSGPLSSLALGSSASETRTFDGRYVPTAIGLTGLGTGIGDHTWSYATDGVGNVLEIVERQVCPAAPLQLQNQTVTTTQAVTHCSSIEAGPAYVVGAGGDVTFDAAGSVVLQDGFSVLTGGSFTAISAGSPELSRRSYAYQDPQYFLTAAEGPWGTLDWSYDQIGNRLSETRDDGASSDSYQYVSNAGGANTPILDLVTLAVLGTRDYTWDAAGNLDQVAAGANVVDVTFDAASRLASADRTASGGEAAAFLYDGRGFLRSAQETVGGTSSVEPLYDSAGLLHALRRQPSPTDPIETTVFFYIAARPVAQLTIDGTGTWTYLTTDHLGTPLLATDATGTTVWQGGFEPFGSDYQQGTPAGARDNGIYLRLPGQWDDATWADATSGAEIHYNVHRWYQPGSGRYTRPDPLGLAGGLNVYAYGQANPLTRTDPVGRQSRNDAHVPTPDEIQRMIQRSCARQAFYTNYSDMREANWKLSDKYFHCKANCEAARCGDEGYEQACELSDAREFFDQLIKGDPPSASRADQAANLFGREQARKRPNATCQIVCARYRPKGLPPKY